MEIKKTETIQHATTVAYKCDACGTEYREHDDGFTLRTSHNSWGSDSGESYEYTHSCSVKCLRDNLQRKWDELRKETRPEFELFEMNKDQAQKLWMVLNEGVEAITRLREASAKG